MKTRVTKTQLVSVSRRPAMRLLLAALCCIMLAGITQAEDFDVPGTSGHNWVNTGLDIAPGTLVQLSAIGQVDVGWGWGVHGPGGTTQYAGGPSYPSNIGSIRYGLVARLTASRTSPQDQMHEDWVYGENPQHCARQGGHLWLTVNDDDPDNNTGLFKVHVEQTSCLGQPERARFRVTMMGFRVNNATTENILSTDGAGDEVFALVNFAELSSSNSIIGGAQSRQSLLYGDIAGQLFPFGARSVSGGQPTVIQAGHASPTTGGLRNRDRVGLGGEMPMIPGNADELTRARLIPMVLWEGELRRGGPNPNGVVILPTIWEQDNVPDVMFNVWNRSGAPDFIGRFAQADSARFIIGGVPRPLVEQVEANKMTMPTPRRNDFDRPIGIAGEPYNPFVTPNPTTFIPAVMLLTFNSAQEAANSAAQGPGIVEIHYRDGERYGPGSYTMFLRVERLP
jgi:hypothetical protein